MKKILISGCLMGQNVKYSGGNNLIEDSKLFNYWLQEDIVIPFCPEVEGGLEVPRSPCEIQAGDTSAVEVLDGEGRVMKPSGFAQEALRKSAEFLAGVKVMSKDGEDVTEEFVSGAQKTLDFIRNFNEDNEYDEIVAAVLKSGSPSCGTFDIYDGSFQGLKVSGMGLTAKLLAINGIPVFDEHQLQEAEDYVDNCMYEEEVLETMLHMYI